MRGTNSYVVHFQIKFTELTLDAFRMLQCLEWEPSGSFYQKRPLESSDNGALNDQSGASGLIDINLSADMTDPTLPPNPKKTILYRPSVTHLIAVSVEDIGFLLFLLRILLYWLLLFFVLSFFHFFLPCWRLHILCPLVEILFLGKSEGMMMNRLI